MPRRPVLSDDSFLASVFRPSKNPRPVGLRKRTIAKTRARRTSRVKSYNRFDATKQEILERTGNRERYLRGEVSLAEARQELRVDAIARGIAKPYVPTSERRRRAIANIERLAHRRPVRLNQGSVNPLTIQTNVAYMSDRQLTRAINLQTYEDLLDASQDDDETLPVDADMNVFFYK